MGVAFLRSGTDLCLRSPTLPAITTMRSTDATESPSARPRSPSQADRTPRGHRPRPSEAYGFAGTIAAAAAAAAYLAWAYAPEPWLRSLGATYYPSKQWALAVPAFVAMTVAQGLVLYVASNFLLAAPPACIHTISDEHAREPSSSPGTGAEGEPIEPISDVSVDRMNHLMFGDRSNNWFIHCTEDALD